MTGFQGVSGLASGIDTAAIVDASVDAAGGQKRILESKKERVELELEAVRTLNVKLLGADLDLSTLKQRSTLDGRSVSSSDSDVLQASLDGQPDPGVYHFTVDRIATAKQMSSDPFTNASDQVGTGTFVLGLGGGVGGGDDVSITIDATNNTLEGLAKAINDATDEVAAQVLYDGTSYHLLLTGTETGDDGDYTIDASGLSGGESATLQQAFAVNAEARDALVRYGADQGAAISITSSNNTLEDIVPGLTLDLLSDSTDKVVITVEPATTAAKEALTTYLTDLNDALSYYKANASYDSDTKEAGILQSQSTLRNQINKIVTEMTEVQDLGDGSTGTITELGITYNEETGLFDLDQEKLSSALAEDPQILYKFFANQGESSNVGIEFVTLGAKTDVSEPFAVSITQAATRATITGTDLAATTTIDADNDVFSFMINGTQADLNLAHGDYDREELRQMLQDLVDSSETLQKKGVEITLDGDALSLSTRFYGSGQKIAAKDSSALADFGFAINQTASGQDVVGTINGVVARGSGQALYGAEGSAAEGLVLLAKLTQSQVDAGNDEATVTASRGASQRIDDVMSGLLDAEVGVVVGVENAIQTEIGSINESISRQDQRLAALRARLDAEFLAMETLINQFNAEGQFITGQLEAFANMSAATANNR